MTTLKAGVAAIGAGLLLASPAWGIGGASKLDQLLGHPRATTAIGKVVLTSTTERKRAKSCNAGNNRKNAGKSPAAVNAWAVACEFPPRSQALPSSALQNAVATAAILGG